jgi:sigma-B regulation protein RsbU (phosphoserine phosphatase)
VSPDFLPFQFAQTELRSKLPFFGVATVILVAGISSLLLAALRSREKLLFWLGIFSVLYASRLFMENGLVHTALGTDDSFILPWTYSLTYLIPIPYAAFARELLGSGWKGSITFWFWIQVAFALVAIPTALYSHQPHWTDLTNGILVIGGTLLMLFHIIFPHEKAATFAIGLAGPLIVAGVLVLATNRGYRPAGINVEPLGFLVLLAGLGFTASQSVIARERKLIEVEQELTTARGIQSAIIPDSSPKVPGLRIATRYQPMTAVAGDFFDFLKTGKDSLTILVADVSGHGVPAALVASMLKVCFAAQREHAKNPAEVLAGLNAMLRGSLGGQYVTAACAAIDLATQTITYSGAGHPPGLLLRRSKGDVMQLAENGLFIGPFPHATYSNVAVPFETGDKLLLYTDGILEATDTDGQEFGQKRVEELLLNTENLGPAEIIEQLFREISTPAQQDDLTVVLTQFVSKADNEEDPLV